MSEEIPKSLYSRYTADNATITNLADLRHEMESCGLGKLYEDVAPHAKNAIVGHLLPKDDGLIPVGATKAGGAPDLPDSFIWPTYKGKDLAFLMQINFSELGSALPIPDGMPESGMLWVFISPRVPQYKIVGEHVHVVYRNLAPTFLNRNENLRLESSGRVVLAAHVLSAHPRLTIPEILGCRNITDGLTKEEGRSYIKVYFAARRIKGLIAPTFQLGGHTSTFCDHQLELYPEYIQSGINVNKLPRGVSLCNNYFDDKEILIREEVDSKVLERGTVWKFVVQIRRLQTLLNAWKGIGSFYISASNSSIADRTFSESVIFQDWTI